MTINKGKASYERGAKFEARLAKSWANLALPLERLHLASGMDEQVCDELVITDKACIYIEAKSTSKVDFYFSLIALHQMRGLARLYNKRCKTACFIVVEFERLHTAVAIDIKTFVETLVRDQGLSKISLEKLRKYGVVMNLDKESDTYPVRDIYHKALEIVKRKEAK